MMEKIEKNVILELRLPRDTEHTPETMAGVFASLSNIRLSFLDRLLGKGQPIVFEIATYEQVIHFYAVVPLEYRTYFESQLSAQYPKATLTVVSDYLPGWLTKDFSQSYGQLKLTAPFYYPLKTYTDFKETDPLSAVLGTMAMAEKEEKMLMQIVILPAGSGWQQIGASVVRKGILSPDGRVVAHPHAKIIELKINQQGFNCAIRLLVCSPYKSKSQSQLKNLAGSFGSLSLGEGNALSLSRPSFLQDKKFLKAILTRRAAYFPGRQVLNIAELATIFHLPSLTLAGIRNIAWGTRLVGEPPDNLPTSFSVTTDEEKKLINFFAKTEYKNKMVVYGIKKRDRAKHVYIIGKSGTGKSTLIANMAINDMRNGEGIGVIDPHGDLSANILDYVPSNRINDVCYLDPSDIAHPFHLNFLEVKNPELRELVASGIVAIFYKLYSYSWGPRLEYILRNSLLTLLHKEDTTLVDVPRILTDKNFRAKVLEKCNDPVLLSFWHEEYDTMSEKMMSESISSILNKVGQFVASPMIRGIIGHPKSTIDVEEVMNSGKILILNLSSGRLGEDNSTLLGAMFISKIQLAAMNRVNIPEEQRKDFYFYVDEFQNFANTSFVKILSEARKYRLNLTLANQYIAQVPEEIRDAIFGNVGSLMSFIVGAEDASILSREFGEVYSEAEMVSLGNYQIINKISIDNLTSRPFYAFTLPLPNSKNQNREKVVRLSREKFTKPVEEVPVIIAPIASVNPVSPQPFRQNPAPPKFVPNQNRPNPVLRNFIPNPPRPNPAPFNSVQNPSATPRVNQNQFQNRPPQNSQSIQNPQQQTSKPLLQPVKK